MAFAEANALVEGIPVGLKATAIDVFVVDERTAPSIKKMRTARRRLLGLSLPELEEEALNLSSGSRSDDNNNSMPWGFAKRRSLIFEKNNQ